MAPVSLISACMATAAGTPSRTRVWATPVKTDCPEASAPSQALR